MNTIHRITKNVGVLFISQILSYVLGFFALMYSARYLGVEGYGTLSLALAFTGILSIFMDLGLSTLTIREVARDKNLAKDYIANITSIKIVLAIITLLSLFIIVQLLGYNQQTILVIYIIALYALFTTFSQLFYAVFQAYEKMEYQSIGTILSSFLLFIGVFVAIYLKLNIVNFSLIYLVSGVSILVYALIIYHNKLFLPKMRVNLNQWKLLIKESWPFAITSISINIFTFIDTIILSVIQGTVVVGLYNASYNLVLVLIFIPVVFNNAVFPLMSQYFISSKESLSLTFEKLLKTMILIAMPIGIGTVLIAQKVILFFYGEQFLGAVIAMQILIWSIVLTFIRSPFERLLESTNKQLIITKVFVIGAIFNIILNLIIIPKYSYIGAGIVTVLSDALILGLLVIATRSLSLFISKNMKISLIKIIVASLIMGIVLRYFLDLNVFIIIIIGMLIYALMLLVLKIFDANEIRIIKSIVKLKKVEK